MVSWESWGVGWCCKGVVKGRLLATGLLAALPKTVFSPIPTATQEFHASEWHRSLVAGLAGGSSF